MSAGAAGGPGTGAIHAGLRALGLASEEDRRALYARVTGKDRLRAMSPAERRAVFDELRRLGWRPAPPAGAGRIGGPYGPKLRALWIAGWNLGLVRDVSDRALIAFVRRQTGLDAPRFLTDPILAARAIEALKSWLAREGGVDWTPPRGTPRWLVDPRACVAFAQWRRLAAPETFRAALAEALGRELGQPPDLAPADWQAAMNLWGARLREEAGR